MTELTKSIELTEATETETTETTDNTDILFQIIEFDYFHESHIETVDKKKIYEKLYKIRFFGITSEGRSITVKANNFTPFFYFEIEKDMKRDKINELMAHICSHIGKKYIVDGLIKYNIIEKIPYYGFTGNTKNKYVQLIFKNMLSFKGFEKWIENNEIDNKSIFRVKTKLKLFESNIEPFIRCLHMRNFTACGWIKLVDYEYSNVDSTYSSINVETDWQNLIPYNENKIQKLIIASFDIECMSESGDFPQATNEGDMITQIGTVFSYYGESEPFYKNIITLGTCKKIEGLDDVDILECDTEAKVLLTWTTLIQKLNPDVITGYNINGFDFSYMYNRADYLEICEEFQQLSRVIGEKAEYKEKSLQSAAFGDNLLKYFQINGRIIVDLMKVIQRDHKLDSYKLDNVASTFIRENIKSHEIHHDKTKIWTSSVYGITTNNFITIIYNDGLTDNKVDIKYSISNIDVTEKTITINGIIPEEIFTTYNKLYWSHAKDDISPNELFSMFKGSSEDRGIIAKYCIQDCVLVTKILEKLQIMTNNIAMANVCGVPLSYIFMRGQSPKIFSLVSKKCRELGYLIPTIKPSKEWNDSKDTETKKKKIPKNKFNPDVEEEELCGELGYEGATVFDPVRGVHYEPIPVLDYASLYPKSMIYRNISHETLVLNSKYENVPGYSYHTVNYTNSDKSITTCKYAYSDDGTKSVLSLILISLLEARTEAKKMMGKATDKFLKAIYDGFQLAYKVTANSLYGQLGAKTSAIYLIQLAASTTATGREMLELSRDFIESPFKNLINLALTDEKLYIAEAEKLYTGKNETLLEKYPSIYKSSESHKFVDVKNGLNTMDCFIKYFYDKIKSTLSDNFRVNPVVIYGDTDSVFFSPKIYDTKTLAIQIDKNALKICIELGKLAGDTICKILPDPEEQVYEKTLWPFIIITKKKYVGNLYESDVNKFYQKSMGIVLKRRDNAKIVKIVVGGIVNCILNERSNRGAINYTQKTIKNVLKGNYHIDNFVVSKTLKNNYKDRTRIVHAVLADRIGERDPGNKPAINDRIPYIYIITKNPLLQGDRVEDPKYAIDNKLEIDYLFYITNQIMKPSIQFLELISKKPEALFENYINKEINRRKNMPSIMKFFKNTDDEDVEHDMIKAGTEARTGAEKEETELHDKYNSIFKQTFVKKTNPMIEAKKQAAQEKKKKLLSLIDKSTSLKFSL